MIAYGVVASYWFYNMAAITLQIYFRFLVWLRLRFKKVKAIGILNFDQISQSTAKILLQCTPGFWKQAAAIFKFYFRLRFWPFHCQRHVVFHRHTKFHRNLIIRGGVTVVVLGYRTQAVCEGSPSQHAVTQIKCQIDFDVNVGGRTHCTRASPRVTEREVIVVCCSNSKRKSIRLSAELTCLLPAPLPQARSRPHRAAW